MPPFTTNTICYDPLTSGFSTTTTATAPNVYTTSGPTISFTYENTEEKMRKYCDKVDQHVDKLEEDIEFLNDKRKSNEGNLEQLINQNIEQDAEIKNLINEIKDLQGYINYLVDRISMLEGKINA